MGRALSSDRDMRDAIREGFPPAVVRELMRASGLTLRELASALDLSPRSLQRRRRSGRLARYKSDRLYRLARIVGLANKSLGDRERALRWLKRPNPALAALRSWPHLTLNWEPGRWRAFWAVLPTAESVESHLPGVAQSLCSLSIQRRRSLPLRRTMVEPRNPPELCLRASIPRNAGVFRAPRS